MHKLVAEVVVGTGEEFHGIVAAEVESSGAVVGMSEFVELAEGDANM